MFQTNQQDEICDVTRWVKVTNILKLLVKFEDKYTLSYFIKSSINYDNILLNSSFFPLFVAYPDTSIATICRVSLYWYCYVLPNLLLYTRSKHIVRCVASFQRYERVLMLSITRRKRFLKQDTPLMIQMFAW